MKRQGNGYREGLETRRGGSVFEKLALAGTLFGVMSVVCWMPGAWARTGFAGGEQDQNGAGVMVSKQATAKDVGLPVYPGAKAHKDEKDDSATVQMGLWGGAFGFKLAVMKMDSNDAPEEVAEFYKKALAKYGTVLNCTEASQKASAKEKKESSNQISCDDDKPEKGGLVFKAGTKEKQRIVGIQPNGQGSLFQLVYVEARGDDKEKKAN